MSFGLNLNPNITIICHSGSDDMLQSCHDLAEEVDDFLLPFKVVLISAPALIALQKLGYAIYTCHQSRYQQKDYIALKTDEEMATQESSPKEGCFEKTNDQVDRHFATILMTGMIAGVGVVTTKVAPFLSEKVCPILVKAVEDLCENELGGLKHEIFG